jgi:hypothetical protein
MRLTRIAYTIRLCDVQTSPTLTLPSGFKQPSPLPQDAYAVKPANYVSLKRDVVSGTFAIDPTLKVPPWLQVAPQAEPWAKPEWNLQLTSTSTKSGRFSDVEIHLLPGEQGVESSVPTTRMCVKSSNGAQVKLVSALPMF